MKRSKILAWLLIPLFIIGLFIFVNGMYIFIDKEFRSYHDEFMMDALKFGVVPNFAFNVTIFSSLIAPKAGRCFPYFNLVRINRNIWNNRSKDLRRILLYHEWGHCILNRGHSKLKVSLDTLKCPITIMYPSIDDTGMCFKYLNGWYMEELFTNPFNLGGI